MTGGLSSTAVVLHAQLLWQNGDRGGAQAELHRVARASRRAAPQQQPGHHALHVVELDVVRLADAHRALHPGVPRCR